MADPEDDPARVRGGPARAEAAAIDRVQCPNCCRMAFVTERRMGLLFYRCQLCETTGATPEPQEEAPA